MSFRGQLKKKKFMLDLEIELQKWLNLDVQWSYILYRLRSD